MLIIPSPGLACNCNTSSWAHNAHLTASAAHPLLTPGRILATLGMNTVLLTAAASLGVRIWAYAVRHIAPVAFIAAATPLATVQATALGLRWGSNGLMAMYRAGPSQRPVQFSFVGTDGSRHPHPQACLPCSCCRASGCIGGWRSRPYMPSLTPVAGQVGKAEISRSAWGSTIASHVGH